MTRNLSKRAEINKRYIEHLHSLALSGLEYDRRSVIQAWQKELDELEED